MLSPDRLHQPFASLLGKELRAVGLALTREAMLAGALLALFCILVAATAIRYHERLTLEPLFLLPGLLVALLLPWAVWKGDPPFGRAVLWTLPVRRQNLAVAKIIAGALWLMLALSIALAALALMTLVTGGSVGAREVRVVAGPSGGLADAVRMSWTTPLWMWIVPFGGALLAYLLSTAALVGLRQPVRWVAGAAVAVALVMVMVVNIGPHSAFGQAFHRTLETLAVGRFGLDFALSGGSAALVEDVRVPGHRYVELWDALPSVERWATALLVWLGGALLALALALRRHWER